MNTSIPNPTHPSQNHQFGFWRSLRLAFKLMMVFGVTAVLILVVAGVTLGGLNRVTATYKEVISSDIEVRRLALQFNADLLQARRAEKNFLLRWKSEGFDTAYANYITTETEDAASTRGPAYIQNVTAMREDLKQLAPFGPDVEVSTSDYTQAQFEADLASLAQYTDTYEQSFNALVEALKQRGANENTGLELAIRDAAHGVETLISGKAGLEPLEITYLQMRRHEKDYLARGGQEYVDSVHASVSELKTEAAGSEALDPAQKAEIRTSLDEYLKKFDEIVSIDAEIVTHDTAVINAGRAMEPVAARLNTLGEQMAADDINMAYTESARTFATSMITVVVALILTLFAAIILSQQVTRPVTSLTNTAKQIASGNFGLQAEVTSADEIGTLAQTFNFMTSRLEQAFKEVAARSKNLATVAEISTRTTTIRDPFQMLATMVHLTQRGFNLYHAHVFTYHADEDKLQIVACGYKEGDEHEGTHGTMSIPLQQEQSLVARAGRTRMPVIVNDVRSDPGWLPNPLLPDTHAELAVPMIVGDELVGVLDVQADHTDAFTMEDANIQMTLAAEIATAYQNALSYEKSKSQANLESMINTISQKIQRAATIEETLAIAVRELGMAMGARSTRAVLESPVLASQRDEQNAK